jgi:hypothetical protein
MSIQEFDSEDMLELLCQYKVINREQKLFYSLDSKFIIEDTPLYKLGARYHELNTGGSPLPENARDTILNHYISYSLAVLKTACLETSTVLASVLNQSA